MTESDIPHQGFNRTASAYDLLVNESKRWGRESPTLTEWLESAGEGARRVLDLGCGTGFHARHMAGLLRAVVTAADPAPEMLEAGQSRPWGNLVRWVQATAQTPPAGPFDLVLLLGNTLSLIADPTEVIQAVADVVVGSGLFVIQMLDFDKLRELGGDQRTAVGGGLSVEKLLRPRIKDSEIGADLRITVRDDADLKLAEENHVLWDHPMPELISFAEATGWQILCLQSSYRPEVEGPDRILILEKRGQATFFVTSD